MTTTEYEQKIFDTVSAVIAGQVDLWQDPHDFIAVWQTKNGMKEKVLQNIEDVSELIPKIIENGEIAVQVKPHYRANQDLDRIRFKNLDSHKKCYVYIMKRAD